MDKKNPFLMGLFAPAEIGVMPNKSPAFQFYHPSPYFWNHYFFVIATIKWRNNFHPKPQKNKAPY